MVSPSHHLQKKIHKNVHDYSQKSIDNFRLFFVNSSPKLTDEEKVQYCDFFFVLFIISMY